ncbi:reverse transcriptase domain-containing protein [Hyphomicrobium denitrificans]|nr:reverse transcriptase domain-containing protein [Hyphomicrobium denitrificans]
MPVDTAKYPRPSKHFTIATANRIWEASRDASRNPGVAGIDGVSATQFSQNLQNNLRILSRSVIAGSFRFKNLRPFFPPKKNGGHRVICVPTVADRLVQRMIVESLTTNDRFRLVNDASYGFIRGRSVRDAVAKAIATRTNYEWVLKTDIESYFDRISRDELADKIKRKLGQHSLVPLLLQAIRCEVRTKSHRDRDKLAASGVVHGQGLRQGMPLSPLLSNLVLGNFDRKVQKAGFRFLRYADDLIVFGASKSEVEAAFGLIVSELEKLGHTVPEPGEKSKTQYVCPQKPVEFLGVDIFFKGEANSYVCRIPKNVKLQILTDISEEYAYANIVKRFGDLGALARSLSGVPAAYRNAYSHADDWPAFEPQLRKECSRAFLGVYEAIFGKQAISGLEAKARAFLGIKDIQFD